MVIPGSTWQLGIVGTAAGRCTTVSPHIVFPAGWLCSDLKLLLELLLELLSCSEGSSGVRGPSGGHTRTVGGHSSPALGYLGNTHSQGDDSVFKKCSFSKGPGVESSDVIQIKYPLRAQTNRCHTAQGT